MGEINGQMRFYVVIFGLMGHRATPGPPGKSHAAKTNVNGSGNAIAVGANANAIVNNFHPVERHMNDERWNEILSIINENKVTSKNVIDVVVDGPGGEKFDYANEIVDRLKKEGFQTSPESVSTSFDGHVNGVIYRFDPNNLHRFVIKVGDNN
jgi:hypothetical protein